MLPPLFAPAARRAAVLFPALALIATAGAAQSVGTQSVQSFARVEVRGAQFIPEQDIQMTCGAVPNVPYLSLELRAIEDCLMSTGVFESVVLYPEGETLVIEVEELNNQPGRIEGSLSYASQDGLIGGLFFERYNLLPDTYGSVRLEYNSEVKRGVARLYHVDFIGEHIDLGFRSGWEELSYDDRSFSSETAQIEAYLAWTITDTTRLEAGLGYRDYSLFDVAHDASALLLEEETDNIAAPYVRLGLNHSSFEDGERGWGSWEYNLSMDQYFWNLGTDDRLSDFRFESRSYVPLGAQSRMLITLEAGTVSGQPGNATRVLDRFAPGADVFRGFAPRGVGPRDNGDGLGGNKFAVSSVEFQHNFEALLEAPLVAGIFWQTGAAWGLDDTQNGSIDDDYHQRSSVGLSLSFEVGNTPIALYMAKPVEKEDGDEEQVFGLSLSKRF
ncbi:BamA/TamA family outer membrane protein [Celeribacter sp. ULVN23_4]